MSPRPPHPTLFPYTTLFRSDTRQGRARQIEGGRIVALHPRARVDHDQDGGLRALEKQERIELRVRGVRARDQRDDEDRKSTRLNSSHGYISYAVFCLQKKRNCSISSTPDSRGSATASPSTSRSSARPPSNRRSKHWPNRPLMRSNAYRNPSWAVRLTP